MQVDELIHFGILGMKWGRRKHQDHYQIRDGVKAMDKIPFTYRHRDKLNAAVKKGENREKMEVDYRVAQRRKFIAKQDKKAFELSDKELSKIVNQKSLQKKLADIDDAEVKRNKLIVGGLLAAYVAVNVALITSEMQ